MHTVRQTGKAVCDRSDRLGVYDLDRSLTSDYHYSQQHNIYTTSMYAPESSLFSHRLF